MAQVIGVEQVYTDFYQKLGASYRMDMHGLYVYADGTKTWHYFGSTPLTHPPTTADPVVQHARILFPADFTKLGDEADQMWNLAMKVGIVEAGL